MHTVLLRISARALIYFVQPLDSALIQGNTVYRTQSHGTRVRFIGVNF